jgi:hypothetical protein
MCGNEVLRLDVLTVEYSTVHNKHILLSPSSSSSPPLSATSPFPPSIQQWKPHQGNQSSTRCSTTSRILTTYYSSPNSECKDQLLQSTLPPISSRILLIHSLSSTPSKEMDSCRRTIYTGMHSCGELRFTGILRTKMIAPVF